MIAGTLPIPNNGIIKPNIAREGIVCIIAVMLMTISAMDLNFVSIIPNGTAINTAINSEIKDNCICSTNVFHNVS